MSSNRVLSSLVVILFTLGVRTAEVAAQSAEEANTAAMKRFYEEAMVKGNMNVIDELVADSFVEHYAPDPQIPADKAGLRQMMGMFHTAFPDLQVTIEDIIAKGDKVWAYTTMRGTHKGEFMGLAATGKKIEVKSVDIVRFVNGKAIEHWGLNDDYTMMMQLGVIPAPGQEQTKQ